tara:strand:- start:4735 stop:5799 length:1065 start_codon:yes stop_codon:yes gene_type:complete
MANLNSIGYNYEINNNIDEKMLEKYEIARVVSVHKNSYIITNGEVNASAQLAGSLTYKAESAVDLPTTGDWVYASFYDDNSFAVIHSLIPRTTELKRKSVGDQTSFQLIGANIDVALIVQSVDFNLNVKRLERYLVMINEAKIKPVILLSKCDLIPTDEVEEIKKNILEVIPDIEVVEFSNLDQHNITIIEESLIVGKTYCLMGSSGVGKTSLLNNILGDDKYETQGVSKKENKGKHTTTSRELTVLKNGAILIDTPGMRELGNLLIDDGLDETFSEITNLPNRCKFSDCMHMHEKGCAILQAVEDGIVTKERYENYIKIKQEAAFNEMPKYERKRKNKSLSKQVKSSKKKYRR